MAMNTREFMDYMKANKKRFQKGMYREDDLYVNGDDEYYQEFSDELEEHPIYLGAKGLRGCSAD